MTQTADLIKKMADFFKGEEYYEKGEDARLELSPDDVRCMNRLIHTCDLVRKNNKNKEISLQDISQAVLKMWVDKMISDSEYKMLERRIEVHKL